MLLKTYYCHLTNGNEAANFPQTETEAYSTSMLSYEKPAYMTI